MNKARITIRFDRHGQAVAGNESGEKIRAERDGEAEKFGEYESLFFGDYAGDQEKSEDHASGQELLGGDVLSSSDEPWRHSGDTANFGGGKKVGGGTADNGSLSEDLRGRSRKPSEDRRSLSDTYLPRESINVREPQNVHEPQNVRERQNVRQPEYERKPEHTDREPAADGVERAGRRVREHEHNVVEHFEFPEQPNRPVRYRTTARERRGSEDKPYADSTDPGEWHSPYEAEIRRIERLIREAERERAHPTARNASADAPPATQPPQHVTAEVDRDRREGPIISDDVYSYVRKTKTPWTKIVFSVSSAVVTGILFGWFVLSMFAGHDDAPVYRGESGMGNERSDNGGIGGAPSSDTPSVGGDEIAGPGRDTDLSPSNAPSGAESPSPAAGTDPNMDESANSAASVLELPAQSWIMLQFGVFSTLDGTKQAQQQLFDRGFAGVSEQRDDYFVFAGIAANRDQAIPLKRHLDEAGLETYLKEYPLPAASIPWNGRVGPAAEYFRKGGELVRQISSLCAEHLKNGGGTKMADADLAALYDLHREWSSAYTEAKAGLPSDMTEQTEKMNNALNMAIVSLDAYQKNASNSHLWQAEAAAAQYVLLLRGLLAEYES